MLQEDLLQPSSSRDKLSTVDNTGHRKWMFVAKPDGYFYKRREILSLIYLAIFFGLPFIKVNGMPLLMFNVVEGKFILFSKIFWPNDFFIFAFAMITFIIFIVLFTIAYGRLFCGWACPQTIFMEFVFRKIEWWIEGTPSQQQKLNNSSWTTEKIMKKSLKHILFFAISFLIAHTFLSYIIGVDKVVKDIREPFSEHVGLFIGLVVFSFLFYFVFAFVREIVCTTICPYGRLQGVMFDKDTMQISYDYIRGEPRGKMSKNSASNLGDCIDCKKCVHVCPTGIDIRNGVQLDCVGCTACIDACDEVMEKIHRPKGLIRYASENQISESKHWVFTPRMKAYTVLLSLLMLIMTVLVFTRRTVDTYVSRARGPIYQELGDTAFSNLYNAKIINKSNKDLPIKLVVENMPGKVKVLDDHSLTLKKEAINQMTFFVEVPKTSIKKRSNILKIAVYSGDKKIQSVKTKFLGPFM
jgi:cytochrome c oxidase accessory protein FixG